MSLSARPAFTIDLPSRYRVERVIGRGGSSTVLAAQDLRLQRRVAIKVFTESASTVEVLLRQEREAQLLAGLAHPGLVTVFDVASDAGTAGRPHGFLVMEFVDGPDLAQWLRVNRADTGQVAQLGIGLCAALDFVHRSGVLHCDIKPSNVLLRLEPGGVLIPKLSDFGIAAVLQGSVPQGEFTVGTAAYLSPEQVEGAPLQAPSDTYALGLVLLEAATGHVAFPGNVLESALARLDSDPRIPLDLAPGLAAVLRGMTTRDPSQRLTLQEAGRAFQALDGRSAASGPVTVQGDQPAGGAHRGRTDPAPDDEEGDVAQPAFRTLAPNSRMVALERATDLANRVVQGTGAVLVAFDEDSTAALHGVVGLTEPEASRLAARIDPAGKRPAIEVTPQDDDTEVVRCGITGTRGESLGVLAVRRPARRPLDEGQRSALTDTALLAGQIIELRTAVRRALLSR